MEPALAPRRSTKLQAVANAILERNSADKSSVGGTTTVESSAVAPLSGRSESKKRSSAARIRAALKNRHSMMEGRSPKAAPWKPKVRPYIPEEVASPEARARGEALVQECREAWRAGRAPENGLVRDCLQQGADLRAESGGSTALQWLAMTSKPGESPEALRAAIHALLEHGADPLYDPSGRQDHAMRKAIEACDWPELAEAVLSPLVQVLAIPTSEGAQERAERVWAEADLDLALCVAHATEDQEALEEATRAALERGLPQEAVSGRCANLDSRFRPKPPPAPVEAAGEQVRQNIFAAITVGEVELQESAVVPTAPPPRPKQATPVENPAAAMPQLLATSLYSAVVQDASQEERDSALAEIRARALGEIDSALAETEEPENGSRRSSEGGATPTGEANAAEKPRGKRPSNTSSKRGSNGGGSRRGSGASGSSGGRGKNSKSKQLEGGLSAEERATSSGAAASGSNSRPNSGSEPGVAAGKEEGAREEFPTPPDPAAAANRTPQSLAASLHASIVGGATEHKESAA